MRNRLITVICVTIMLGIVNILNGCSKTSCLINNETLDDLIEKESEALNAMVIALNSMSGSGNVVMDKNNSETEQERQGDFVEQIDVESEVQRGKKLVEWILSADKLTELQWNNAFEPFRDKFVIVSGVVKDVYTRYIAENEKTFVIIKIGKLGWQDVFLCFELKADVATEAILWNKGANVCLRGNVWRHFPATFIDGCVDLRFGEKMSYSSISN